MRPLTAQAGHDQPRNRFVLPLKIEASEQGATVKTTRSSNLYRPFENLEALLESKSLNLKSRPASRPPKLSNKNSDPISERRLFLEAMADVKPISREKRIENNPKLILRKESDTTSEAETLQRLKELVNQGKGFVVADTAEYMEGTGYKINPCITRRLHRGEFSIQTHIDLHGLNVEDAKDAFEDFLRKAVNTGKRGVLIVHGRGLSSPAKPILKTKVREWLTRGPWRKWVIAFSSARLCDGGTGGTYVLLRQRPVTKKLKK
jgi:DNA-nicking Smr family endonuclease